MAIITTHYKTPVGELILGSLEEELCLCNWRYKKTRESVDRRIQKGASTNFEKGSSKVIEETKQQLVAYFRGERKDFDLPLKLIGTDFQQRVWQALMEVPYGTTASYAQLTDRIASRTAIRAVAAANGANAMSIIVPCHRIIGSNGELVGYAGGLATKKKLLELEGIQVGQPELDLFGET